MLGHHRRRATQQACPNPLSPNRAPFGLRCYWAICGVAAPQRCSGIACVAAPCIWPPTFRTGAATRPSRLLPRAAKLSATDSAPSRLFGLSVCSGRAPSRPFGPAAARRSTRSSTATNYLSRVPQQAAIERTRRNPKARFLKSLGPDRGRVGQGPGSPSVVRTART